MYRGVWGVDVDGRMDGEGGEETPASAASDVYIRNMNSYIVRTGSIDGLFKT